MFFCNYFPNHIFFVMERNQCETNEFCLTCYAYFLLQMLCVHPMGFVPNVARTMAWNPLRRFLLPRKLAERQLYPVTRKPRSNRIACALECAVITGITCTVAYAAYTFESRKRLLNAKIFTYERVPSELVPGVCLLLLKKRRKNYGEKKVEFLWIQCYAYALPRGSFMFNIFK